MEDCAAEEISDCCDGAEDSDHEEEEEATTTDHDDKAASKKFSVKCDLSGQITATTEFIDKSANERNKKSNKRTEEETDGIAAIENIKKHVMEDVMAFRRKGSRMPEVDIHKTRRRLFAAARADDQITTDIICKEIKRFGGSLIQDNLQDVEDKKTALHQALLNRSMKAADTLIKYGGSKLLFKNYRVKVQSLNSKMTCMHILCENGETEWVKGALNELENRTKKGDFLSRMVLKKVETHRIRNFSCLHLAAMNGHSSTVELLLKEGNMDVNIKNMKNETPLLWAVRFNRTKTIKLLISHGADINFQNDKGTAPIYWAVKYTNIDAVEVLLNESSLNIECHKPVPEETPILLACSLNRKEIAEKLIVKGAAFSEHSRIDGSTCLHFAAANGHLDIIEILLKQPGCQVNSLDNNYDTPLQLAARKKKLQAVQELLNHNANVLKANKFSETVWDAAIQDKENFLFALLVAHCAERGVPLKSGGEPLLHIAAKCADLMKIEKLFELGLDPDERDGSGNTFYHIAARCNRVTILERFAERVDVNAVNQDGDTAAHVACSQGHIESVQFLISTVNATLASPQDSKTILHIACQSPKAPDQLVKYCIEMTRSALSWDMVNHQDIEGNTALHICAMKGRQELIGYMVDFDCSVKNNDGNTPAMVAAKQKNFECLQTILDTFKSTVHLEQADKNGSTLLHILADLGASKMIEIIIDRGGDISKQNYVGNTMLHTLVDSYLKEKENEHLYLKVIDIIIEKSVIWWCQRTSKPVPLEDSIAYCELRKESIEYLRTCVFNEKGFSALSYAAFLGAKSLVKKLIQIPQVYVRKSGENDIIDITGFTPDTLQGTLERKSKRPSCCCPGSAKQNKINYKDTDSIVHNYPEINEQSKSSARNNVSLLDTIVHVRPLPVANDMLSIIPLKQIVDNYWSMYQWIYAILLIAHVTYMVVLTVYGLETLSDRHDHEVSNNGTVELSYDIPTPLVVYFITYPVVMTLFFACFYYIGTWTKASKSLSWHTIWRATRGVFQTFISLTFLASLLAWLLLVAFGVLEDEINVNYALATALLIGWLHTIIFTNGFQSVHDLTNVLLHMFFQDILRFFVFYAVVLLAFSTAFRALFLISTEITPDHPDVWSVMFGTFNIMFDSGDLLVDDIDGKYNRAGHSVVYLKLLYVAYVISTAAVLLNILIAMLNSTYSTVQEIERSAWKVETIDLAMQIETIFPCIPKLFQLVGLKGKNITHDKKSGRWFMTVPNKELQPKNKSNEISIGKRVQSLEKGLTQLNTVLDAHGRQLKQILDLVSKKKEKKDKKHKRDK